MPEHVAHIAVGSLDREKADDLLKLGLSRCVAGDVRGGLDAFRSALEIDHENPALWYNAAKACRDLGLKDDAIACYEESIRRNPLDADAHGNLGILNVEEGHLDRAVQAFRAALDHSPQRADILLNLGVALHALGERGQARSAFQSAAELEPENPAILHKLAGIVSECGDRERARRIYRAIIEKNPLDVEAIFNCASIAQDLGEVDTAVSLYRRALQIQPDLKEALLNLGVALEVLWDLEEASNVLGEAAERYPTDSEMLNAYANVLRKQGRITEAIVVYQQALALEPRSHSLRNNLGLAYYEAGDLDRANVEFSRALDIDFYRPQTHMNRAFSLLGSGDFLPGWNEFEWRLRLDACTVHSLPVKSGLEPGTSIIGKRILVCGEQGFGDVIQFARYLPLLHDRGAHVFLQCHYSLRDLCTTLRGVERVLTYGEPVPSVDYVVPLLSLPRFFQTTPATLPRDTPYLAADPRRVERFRGAVSKGTKAAVVGVVSAGSRTNPLDHYRSIPCELLRPLAELTTVQFVNLMHGRRHEEWEMLFGHSPSITDCGIDTFADTAAVLDHLDLIIAVDTAVAHLAGALHKRVWLLLPYSVDWRWMLCEGNESLWYPSMRIFRQPRPWAWGDVIKRVVETLQEAIACT